MEFKVSDHCAGQLEDHNTKTIKKNVVRKKIFLIHCADVAVLSKKYN